MSVMNQGVGKITRTARLLALALVTAISTAGSHAQASKGARQDAVPNIPAGKPLAARIGPVYGPDAAGNASQVTIDVLADFVPPARGGIARLNLDEVRGSATLVCSDCDNPREAPPVRARHFSDTGQGITLVVAVETGSAMAGERLGSVKQGLLQLVNNKQPKDKLAIVAVGSDLHLLSDFSTDDAAQRQAIEHLRADPVPYPRLYRALIKSLDLFDQAEKGFPQRRHLLVISTGRNEASTEQSAAGGFRDDDVIARANQANVVVDAIGVPVPLPPRTISLAPGSFNFGDQAIPVPLDRQRLQIPADESVDAYLDALEKIVRTTGGIYLRQETARSAIADRMGQELQWLNDAPVLTFDVSNAIPSDGKKHRIALRLANQPGRDFDAVVTLPPGRSWFRFSPGLAIFIVALLGFSALTLTKVGSKPRRPAFVPVPEAEVFNSAPDTREAPETEHGPANRGKTLKEGFLNTPGTSSSSTRMEFPSNPHDTGTANRFGKSVHSISGPAQHSRSATRVISSWLPAPAPGAPCCCLRILGGASAGRTFAMEFPEATIGREQDANTFAVPDPGISSHHATLRWNSGVVSITDDNSTNGTTVGDVRLSPARPHLLQIGDRIQIGSTLLAFELPTAAGRI